jgi:hypothetical protein
VYQLNQTLFAKPDAATGAAGLPLTRENWYREG